MAGLTKVAVDVGSGLTKVISEEGRRHFASVSGPFHDEGFRMRDYPGSFVEFGGKTYCVGDIAHNFVKQELAAKTTKADWFESKEYLALLYGAFARALPAEFSGRVTLCTGLPVRYFKDGKDKLRNLLIGEKKFRVNGVPYRIKIAPNNLFVVPQACGLFFSALDRIKNVETKKCGFIDVGTYTTGWVMVDNFEFVTTAMGGMDIGASDIKSGLDQSLRDGFDLTVTAKALEEALISKKVMKAGTEIDLTRTLQDIILKTAKTKGMTREIMDASGWNAHADAQIYVGGGAGEMYLPAIRSLFPNCQLLDKKAPMFSVVDGYWKWLDQKTKTKQAAVA